jgi:hypothetical protein
MSEKSGIFIKTKEKIGVSGVFSRKKGGGCPDVEEYDRERA